MHVPREELEDVIMPTMIAIEQVMQNSGRHKHGPYKWTVDSYEEHIHKAVRHLLRWLQIKNGECEPDTEDHLALGMVRACMAHAKRDFVYGLEDADRENNGVAALPGTGVPGGGEVEPVGECETGLVRDNRYSLSGSGPAYLRLAGDGDGLPLSPSEEGDGRATTD